MCKELKIKKFITSVLIICILSVSTLTGCGNQTTSKNSTNSTNKTESQQDQGTRTVTDMMGNSVKVPAKVDRVATSWPGFANAIFTVTGSNNKIVSTSSALKKFPWAMKLYPELKNISYPFSGKNTNMEQLIKDKPDLAFLRKGDSIQNVKDAGIPVVMIDYSHHNMGDLINSVLLTGKILGDSEYKKAQEYEKYFKDNIKKVSSATANIPENEKAKIVYLMAEGGGFGAMGKDAPQDESLKNVGAVNLAENSFAGVKEISLEQIITWNPDTIIVDGTLDMNKVSKDPSWKQLKAVKNNRVFISPSGVFSWARLGSESALQILWLAKTIYPEKFQGIDMTKETKYFYKNFFGYDLTDKEAGQILSAKSPEK